MKTDLDKFPSFQGLERATSGFLASLGPTDPRGFDDFSKRSLGKLVRDARSSWVRTILIGSNTYYVKTYDYPDLRARCRGWFRNTAFAESRPEREWRALQWLRGKGFPSPIPCAVFIGRLATGIRRATLVTEAWPGVSLDLLLPELCEADRTSLITATHDQIIRMHTLGFRDRNLDLRNLLAARGAAGAWIIAKIDSPRFRLVDPGGKQDRLAREDWQRLGSSLARLGMRLPLGRSIEA